MNDWDYLLKYKGYLSAKDKKALKTDYPVQYLVGHVDFLDVKIAVNEKVLIPRFETEFLVEKVLQYLSDNNKQNAKVLDIGTGSGCIAIALQKARPELIITATDICEEALDLAKKNARDNKVTLNFVWSDLFSNLNEKYDVIVSNPPYLDVDDKIMPKVRNFEPPCALFADEGGLALLKDIIKNATKFVKKESLIALEIGVGQGKILKNYAENYFPEAKIIVKKDLQKRERYIFIANNTEKT